MKYCPNCQAEYDEEVIRFCTKDGTPLVEMKEPAFTDNLPSESSETKSETKNDDDAGDETIIRRKSPEPKTESEPISVPGILAEKEDSKRIVISTSGERKEQGIRTKPVVPKRHPEPKRSNTPIVVLLTIIATVLLMLGVFAVYWILTSGGNTSDNSNLSVNENIDLNANVNTNFNLDDLNLNLNSNVNDDSGMNSNSNFNLSTPSPTQTPTPSPSQTPTPSPSPTSSPSNTNTSNGNVAVTPTVRPSPTRTPTPTPAATAAPTPTNTNTTVNVGTINGRAIRLPTPSYPSSARNARAGGRVSVAVTIDSGGNVVAARAVRGHPLLRASAVDAARRSKFRPVSVNGRTVNATGTIVYNFVN